MFKLTIGTYTFAALMVAGALAAITLPAYAAVKSECILYDISADTNASRLTLHCTNDSNDYTAGWSGCPSVNVEQIKMWHSQAMAALLAGKKTNIWYTDPTGGCTKRAMSGFVITNLQ